MAAWAASLLVPIAAELGAARQVIVAQAEKPEAQAERVGRLAAELDAARAADLSRRREHRRLTIALAALVALLLAAGTLAAVRGVW